MDTQNHRPAPAAPSPVGIEPEFIVGQDRRGLWLAVETNGHSGGMFVTRDAALRYAAAECDGRLNAIRMASGPLKLRI